MIRLSRVGLLLWSAMAVVLVVESQTFAAMIGIELSLYGMFIVWLVLVAFLVLLTIWPADESGQATSS